MPDPPKCRNCSALLTDANWTPSCRQYHNRICIVCKRKSNKAYNSLHKEDVKEKQMDYYRKHRKHYQSLHKDYYKVLKVKALQMVSIKLECVVSECSCSDVRYLELNYKSGGHRALARNKQLPVGSTLYFGLIKGKIDPTLFEIMCKAHNAVSHIEKRDHVKWKIVYKGTEENEDENP